MSDPIQRFSSRVGDYARYRPRYAQAAIELLRARCGLSHRAAVADVGSGTGILTEQLLASGAQVFAVEPNDGMRAAAEAQLGGRAGFRSVAGTAEATGLAPESIDLYVAGQAFHWFAAAAARPEALRIVKRGSFGALLWNEHQGEHSAFLAGYHALLSSYAAEFEGIAARRSDEGVMREFFGGAMERASFPNPQTYGFEALRGRLMSSSYAPQPGDPQHEPLLAGLRALFDAHSCGGVVEFPYRTLVYFSRLKPGG